MENRFIPLVILLGVAVGLVFGVLAGIALLTPRPASASARDSVELDSPAQDDFIITVAEAYATDHNLTLAHDRLARLHEDKLTARIENLANYYAPQHDLIAGNLALLAVAFGSKNQQLIALSAPTDTRTLVPTPTDAPTLTATEAPTSSPLPTFTAVPPVKTEIVIVAAAEQQVAVTEPPTPTFSPSPTRLVPTIVAPTNVPTVAPSRTPTLRPSRTPTRRPTEQPTARPTLAPTSTPVPPPAPAVFEPDLSQWFGTTYFVPANVQPGQKYWHLVKAIYCDAFDPSDHHKYDFGCDTMPGGGTGTNIYVMTGGAPIDVIRPDGVNVGNNPSVIGDLKKPGDMCLCTYSFMSSDYRISVAGAPSDAMGGFCLCSHNFGWGSRAHVRYFLYFEYVTR